MTLYVKNMVCERCVFVVRQILDKMDVSNSLVSMGKIDIPEINRTNLETLSKRLIKHGFEILDNRESKLIESIKILLNKLLNEEMNDKRVKKLSQYLSNELHYDYNYLSGVFSSSQGLTVESYFILLKIEKVKELLTYNELTLSEIAYQLGYSSVAHLSGQFKKTTGLTPSYFKNRKNLKQRKSIDKL